MFAASIATTGIVHQASWIIREPYVGPGYNFPLGHRRNAVRSLVRLSNKYRKEHGEFPPRLFDLATKYFDSEPSEHPAIWSAKIAEDEFEEWYYFPEAGELEPADYLKRLRDSRILIASPVVEGSAIVGTVDGEIGSVYEDDFYEGLEKQIQAIVELAAEKRAAKKAGQTGLNE